MPRPFPSWIYNEEIKDWQAPVKLPDLTVEDKKNMIVYVWDEDNLEWKKSKFTNPHFYPHVI